MYVCMYVCMYVRMALPSTGAVELFLLLLSISSDDRVIHKGLINQSVNQSVLFNVPYCSKHVCPVADISQSQVLMFMHGHCNAINSAQN